MNILRRAFGLKESLAGSPSRRAAYYTLVQASYTCLAGSFEMPMACRIVGRIDLVAALYAFLYGFLFLGFALGMKFLRKGSASKIFRLAIILWACLSFSIVMFFPFIRGMGALLCYFILRGLADGFYWSARHRSFLSSVGDSGRDRFALRLQSIVVSLSVIMPIIGGFAITYLGQSAILSGAQAAGTLPAGYIPVFLLAGFAMIIALIFSPTLKIEPSPLSFRTAFGALANRDARQWCLFICIGGVVGAMLAVAAGIQTFGLLKTEFKVGALNASIALVSSFTFFFLGKLAPKLKKMRLGGVLIGSIADFSSRCIYALAPTTIGLVIKSLLDALLVPLKSLMGENVIFALISRLSAGNDSDAARIDNRANSIAELYVFREFFLELSRIVGCFAAGVIFLAISGTGIPDAPAFSARVLIGLSAPMAIVDYLFIRSFAKANERFFS